MTVQMLRSVSMALAASCVAATAFAQPGRPLDAPPRLPAAADTAAPTATTQRQAIRLPESAREAPPRARDDEPLVEPAPEEQLPPARQTSPEVRIEQRRRANRVVEVIVTPAHSTTSYVIVNREGARPLSQQELSAGLSVPRFLQLKF
jgi:glyoxylase-like metal-dependent hydrolase (beta-lactamase superfamily II)